MQQPHAIRFGTLFEGQYARQSVRPDIVYQPAQDLAGLKKAGIGTVLMQLYEAYSGTLLYDSHKFPQFRESAERDYLGETLEAAKKLDMKVWLWAAEKGTPLVGPVYEEFTDCIELDQDNHSLATWDHNFVCQCINSRWRQWVLDVYEEVLTNYSGIECIVVSDEVGYNDARSWGGYCPRCIERFKAKYGEEQPRRPNWEDKDGLWWSFIKERGLWWKDYVSELAATTKRIAPDVSTAIIINWFALTTVLKGIDPWDITTVPDLDIIMSDLFFRVFEHDHPLYQAWVGSVMRALAAQSGKRLFLTSSAYRTVPPADIVVGTLDAATQAEGVFYYNLRHICDRRSNLEAVETVSTAAQAMFERLPDAALDERAAILLPKYLWQEHYYQDSLHLLHELTGMYQCMTLAGVPVKILFETQLAELGKYSMVIIPELFSPPDDLVQRLATYVRSGGLLFMSLQRVDGPQSESERALWDLFSVGYVGRTPAIRWLRSNESVLADGDPSKPVLSQPVYDWPVVQHQLFGGFPTVAHNRAHLEAAAGSRLLLSGRDETGREYPLMIETQAGKGTAILSAESFGATFNSYMQKCAGHPSIWLGRAMAMRNFLQKAILPKVAARMPATVEARGNVATFWWRGEDGCGAWAINHEYSQSQNVVLRLPKEGERCSTEVLFAAKVRELDLGDSLEVEVAVEPSSMAVVVIKR